MRAFAYQRAADASAAVQALAAGDSSVPPTDAAVQVLAGGTTLIDLMKLDVMRPGTIVDINPLAPRWSQINVAAGHLQLGALARMSDVAADPKVQRSYPLIADSLKLAASAQLRNMATLGGNVLQRTRCSYFRDVSYANCNKRKAGSGCAAIDGVNRAHAVLGTSEQCIATYPGDFAQALIALDATVDVVGPSGSRTLPFAQLHRPPGATPQIETTLAPNELISGFAIAGRWPRSVFVKVRDRQSYEFALASAAVALDLQNGVVREARLALGGLATVPWRVREAEALLGGARFDDGLAERAADAALAGAMARKHNAFKIALGKRMVARALRQAAAMEI
jgi:xanthine dehydrogenase YagS FAD-binding subunit